MFFFLSLAANFCYQKLKTHSEMKLRNKRFLSPRYHSLFKILTGVLVFVLLLNVAYFIYNRYRSIQEEKTVVVGKEAEKPAPVLMFKLPVDSFRLEPGQVRPGQNLSGILASKGISPARIDEASRKSQPVFDVRKIKINNPYYFFLDRKDSSKVDYFIYEIDPVEYVVYDFSGDSLKIFTDKKPVLVKIRTASGEISSSLWNTMKEEALDPMLALNLSDIYAWTIDFFGLQKGDKFRVVYEENYVHDKSIGIGRIFAAEFIHADNKFYAFRFTQDNEDSYFDETGKSLKKAFLKAPLKFSRISSRFSNSRFHPVLKIYRPHHGVDYAAPTGTPVHSIGDGTVIAKGYQPAGGGNFLKIKHNSEYTTSYMHLSQFAPGISTGKRVHQGDLIGYVGMTGLASGPHLDFRVFRFGEPIDPLQLKSPPSIPVSKENLTQYAMHRDSLMTRLEAIKF
jgi:murein DD-endopeptidase MepM/ murein hydrolase activator NlpD